MIKSKVQIVLLDPQQGYLDVDPNTEVPFTFSIADVKDLTSKKGTFSKTIKLSGTKNNNKLLNNYFDVNVVDGTFNINRLQRVQVLRNGVPILKEGYLQLVGVEKVQNTSNSTEQLVEYNVVIKDTVADLFTKINQAELTDLEFGYLDHTYNAANVISSFSNDVNDEYKYILPYSDVPSYKLNQFKPAIFAKVYWDKIIDGAGFTYEWANYSADTVQFDKLIIPYNGDELKVEQDYIDSIKVVALKSADTTYTSATTLTFDAEVQDPTSAFNPSTGIYTNQFYIDGNNNLTFTYEIEYEVRLVNPSPFIATLYDLTTTSPSSVGTAKINYVPRLALKKNNAFAGTVILTNSANQFQKVEGATLSPGTTSLGTYTKIVTLASNSALPTNTFKTEIDILTQQVNSFNLGSWREGAGGTVATTNPVNVTAQVVVKNINLTIQPNLQSIAFNSIMRMNTIVPKKIKQSQFIKDIITMYNLYVEVDENDSNRLIFRSRDEYYDAGQEVDWTRKLAKNKQQTVTFLPQVTKKKLILTYKHDDADIMLKGYKDNVNEIYGQVEYTFDSEYVKDIETKELGFSPVAVGQASWGPVLPFINGVAPKTNVKIAINGAQYTNANSFVIENYPGSSATTTTYPLVSHFDAAQNPSFDLNWALNDYYFYGNFGSKTNNNLYNLYWRRTINQINKGKMLTAYFHLTEKDINRLRLNQKIFLNNSWWNINQIIDYKAGKDELTKVELLSVDDSIKFAPFKTNRPRRPAKGDNVIRPIRGFNIGPQRDTNVFITDSPVAVTGRNNFIGDSVKSATIIGDGNSVYSEKSIVMGDGNSVSSDAFVIGDSNIVEEGTRGVVIFGDSITASTGNTLYVSNLEVQGTINGVEISALTGGTVSGDYLPLSGGVLTGPLTAQTIEVATGYALKTASSTASAGNIAWGNTNQATGNLSNSIGGEYNIVSGDKSSNIAGKSNTLDGGYSAILAGSNNYVVSTSQYSAIVAGNGNSVSKNGSFVAGGTGSVSSGLYSSIIGGYTSTASGTYSFAAGGKNLTASGLKASAIGGDANTAAAAASSVVGGVSNTITAGASSSIIGGNSNTINSAGDSHGIFGGRNHSITASLNGNVIIGGEYSVISGALTENVVVLGGIGLTGSTPNTVYVPNINIKNIGSATPIINLGLDANGFVVTGTTGGGSGSGYTQVQPGSNITTGGTFDFPIVSLVASPSVNNLTFSGAAIGGSVQAGAGTFTSLSAGTLSGGTIFSGGTNLYSIFAKIGDADITRVQPGSNITTGGTANNPIVNLAASPFVNNLTFSGTAIGGTVQAGAGTFTSLSATTLSGGTLFSGGTNLYSIFAPIGNAFTGGTVAGATTFTSDVTMNGNLAAVDDIYQTSSYSIQTTTAAVTTLATYGLLLNYVYQIEVNVCAGTPTTTKGFTSKIIASYRRDNLGLTKIGELNQVTNSEFNTASATVDFLGNNIRVRVTGEAGTTIDWGCSLIVNRMPMGVI